MTERWRKKLEGIDGASPSDDVFERAKEGPMRRDDALPGPRMSTRIVTIVAAFLVFALAISVFAIPALRMGNEAAGQASVLLPLWPAQTSDELEQLQAESPAWALDPQQVAERFGQQVMGWPDASASEMNAEDLPAPVACVQMPSRCRAGVAEPPITDCSVVQLDPYGGSYSGPAPTASGVTGAFRTFVRSTPVTHVRTRARLDSGRAGVPAARARHWTDLGRPSGTRRAEQADGHLGRARTERS